MSGIVGYIGSQNAVNIMLDGLKKLEYRGNDSSGIAIFSNSKVIVKKEVGEIKNLEALLTNSEEALEGSVGIGHTRWATHGKVSVANAHPQVAGDIALVHNGIVENYPDIKETLIKKGCVFVSETDTEVLAHLIDSMFTGNLEMAVQSALANIKGTHALIALSARDPDKLVAAANKGSIVIGLGAGEFFIGSDVIAILPHTKDVIFLSSGEIAVITKEGVNIRDAQGNQVSEKIIRIGWNPVIMEKGGYRHFFLKEICEQPRVIHETLLEHITPSGKLSFKNVNLKVSELKQLRKILLTGCGTSLHACLIGKYLFEGISHVSSEVNISSELKHTPIQYSEKTLMVGISQSGETINTIECLRMGKSTGVKTLAITNANDSILQRESSSHIHVEAGPEISIASTKSFTGSITALYLLAVYIGIGREKLSEPDSEKLLKDIGELSRKVEQVIELEETLEGLSRLFYGKKGFIYLARGINYPVAFEGAMKMKELAYVFAEGYPGGEIKHGPLALVDDDTPIVALVPKDKHYESALNDAEEVKARGGTVIAFATEGDREISKRFKHVIYLPRTNYFLTPTLNVIPLQLLAYFVALRRGCKVDRPRNLAKSVTVR